MSLGDVTSMAVCDNCGGRIRHEDWGGCGMVWTHAGRVYCARPTRAEPQLGTVVPA